MSGWDGAGWIGGTGEDQVLFSHYLSVFRLEYQLALDAASGSTKAAFVFGGNDARLMDKDLNIQGVKNGRNESYIAFELDISTVRPDGGLAKFNIYRVGYHPDDRADVPFKSIDIPPDRINEWNKYNQHHFYVDSNFGIFQVYLNGHEAENKISVDDPTTGFGARGMNLNPVGRGNDFISFPMLADVGFRLPAGQRAHFSGLQIRHFRYPSNPILQEAPARTGTYQGIFKDQLLAQGSGLSITDGNFVLDGGSSGALILVDPSRNAAPMLRTEFALADKTVRKARLYVTARGIYEMYLNGERVGADYFNPGLTQYNKHHLYQTYDVTSMLKTGAANALGAWLGEGWWSGNITYSGDNWNYFGDRQSLLAKLVVTYTDGSTKVITSNPRDWTIYADGPIRYGSFFQGEVYDATREAAIKGWSEAGFDDNNWPAAVEVPLEGNSYQGDFTDARGNTTHFGYEDQQIVGQIGQNAGIVKTLTAQSVDEVRPGVFVYDMGQNMVGVPNIVIRNGKRGDVIHLRYAEMRYPDLPEYGSNVGMVMMENIRAANTTDRYTLKGGDEVIQPRFTFHGYRYLELTGIDQALPLTDVKGQVISSVPELSSSFESANELVNKLWQNISWSMRGNFLSIPTDTPARNERMGWSGDINVFSRAATYLGPVNQFLRRHLLAMRDIQREDGRFTDVAPVGGGFGGTLWGSAGIIVAWETYQQYGDPAILHEHYDAMKRYVDFLQRKIETESGVLNEGPLGDWLSPEGNKNDNTLLWTAYYAYDLEIMAKIAGRLGKKTDADDFRQRYAERKRFFNETYVDKNNHKTIKSGVRTGFMGPPGEQQGEVKTDKGQLIDTQASYAIPLAFDLFDESHKAGALANLVATIQRKNTDDGGAERPEYSLMTGFIGTASLNQALSENGQDAIAYRLLQQQSYPSWLYSVVNGATTIWERLNSYTVENGFGGNNSMNSFNHYSFGAVAAWMYNYSLGIQRDPDHPGFKHFVLQPTPDPDGVMTWAKGHYDSMYGRIESSWKQSGKQTTYQFTVPANTTATLRLPATSARQVKESSKKLKKASGIRLLGQEGDRLLLELQSGSYEFVVSR